MEVRAVAARESHTRGERAGEWQVVMRCDEMRLPSRTPQLLRTDVSPN